MEHDGHKSAYIALADGTVFRGKAFGAECAPEHAVVGEVVFNTSLMGYQEILTDPSYAGQIMCFTCPHIGNVGCNVEDVESTRVFTEGVVIRNLSRIVSNFRSQQSFSEYLWRNSVVGVYEVDTRQMVRHIRDFGAQMGAIAAGGRINTDDLVDKARAAGSMEGRDLVKEVTCASAYPWSELPWKLGEGYRTVPQTKMVTRPHVVAIDCGIKHNILRLLVESGFRVTVAPATASVSDIRSLNPDALFISNGPGDPATVTYVVTSVRELLGRVPMFGICLGHQLIAQAVGASTYKLKFGHRGGNHPVCDTRSGNVEITVQNHGFAVSKNSVPSDASISHLNLNDQTVEGLEIPDAKASCIQYHPEASPGPHDAAYLFRRFFERVVGYADNGK